MALSYIYMGDMCTESLKNTHFVYYMLHLKSKFVRMLNLTLGINLQAVSGYINLFSMKLLLWDIYGK